jgi:hypothetical protein
MNKATKILLTISLTSFLASVTGALWGFFLPVGAIFFGLFMIFNALGTETELFDAEQRTRIAKAAESIPSAQRSQRTQRLVPIAATSNQ